MKKGQITIFVLLGIVVIIAFALINFINKEGAKEEVIKEAEFAQNINPEFQPIENYINICLRESSIKSAYTIGWRGGYFVLPLERFDNDYIRVPYYYFNDIDAMPSKGNMESELGFSILKDFRDCINLTLFETQGFNFTEEDLDVKATIINDEVIVGLNYSLTAEKGDTKLEFGKFLYRLPVRLGHIYNISKELVDKIIEEPNYIDLTYLTGQDLDISVINFDKCTDIYLIADNHSRNDINGNYIYMFGAKFQGENCKPEFSASESALVPEATENMPPLLEPAPYSIAFANSTFAYRFKASDPDDDQIFYIDDSSLFDIHPTLGIIAFFPMESQIGIHKINITAVDIQGGIDSKWFYLEIRK